MNILLVYPEIPATFWSFRNALKFVAKKSAQPPLGLLTIAALLPPDWNQKLVDMNIKSLTDTDLLWADYVFISGMNVQFESFKTVIQRANKLGVKVVAGGPLATTEHAALPGVDHFVLNEAEITLPQFLADLEQGTPQPIYTCDQYPSLEQTPVPRWELLEFDKYASMSVQYSRGCPYDCEFCSITMLNGRQPRTKSAAQFLTELTALYDQGWRGPVFVVDDNFIGNKRRLKNELLPALIAWSEERNAPFYFTTEVSINLADDDELVRLMVQAQFNHTFVGIETPNAASLEECGKSQNQSRNLEAAVKKLHRCGLMVSAGFIVGFDQDPPTIFEQQIKFIQSSGIVTAMVGLLNAPSGTRLFERLKRENRLRTFFTGNNMDGQTNFVPKMDYHELIQGYQHILKTIYAPRAFYERVKTFLRDYHLPIERPVRIQWEQIKALLRSIWFLGIWDRGRRYYWKIFFFSLLKHPKKFSLTVTMAIYGFHFRRVVESI
ncbi:DUF4070 domain-containing protein [candidate division KSB1 bacterium]|nr:DUF4070 domain-containing protein [candidate division KSB1 bacterium]